MNIQEKVLLSGERILIDADTGEQLASPFGYKPAAMNAYDAERSYVSFGVAAGNLVSSASGAIVASSTTTLFPSAENTFVCSIGMVVTATPTTPGAGVKPYVLIGTNTTTGTALYSAGTSVTGLPQSSASYAFATFVPPLAVAGGQPITVGLVGTGTASATETFSAVNAVLGLAPQYV